MVALVFASAALKYLQSSSACWGGSKSWWLRGCHACGQKKDVHRLFSKWNLLRKVKSNKMCIILHFSLWSALFVASLQFLERRLSGWMACFFWILARLLAGPSGMRGTVVPDVDVSCRLMKKQHENRITRRTTLLLIDLIKRKLPSSSFRFSRLVFIFNSF